MQSSIERLNILLLQSNEKKSRYFPLDKTTYLYIIYTDFWETVRNLDIFQLSNREKKNRPEIVTKY